jgi:KipI family sensor histidine kinase inhibitor
MIGLTWCSDRHLRLSLGDGTSDATQSRILTALLLIRRADLPALLDLTPAYSTILIWFDLAHLSDPAATESAVRAALAPLNDLAATQQPPLQPARTIEVPACYDGPAMAPDLANVGLLAGLAPADVVSLHSSAEYTVRFIGFSPGFPYLEGLPAPLHVPRLDRPRARVEPGSVAIAAGQAGIYPGATPGGWRIIARTPLRLFDASRERPCLLAIGDRVRFVPISVERFHDLGVRHTPSTAQGSKRC